MKKLYEIDVVKGIIVVTDLVNKGTLEVTVKQPDEIGDNDTNPVYEIANELGEALIENKTAVLQLIGKNKIHLTRTFIGLYGYILLNNVDLCNPHISEANLVNISLPKTHTLVVKYSSISDISATTTSIVAFLHCDYQTVPFLSSLDPAVADSFTFNNNVKVVE